MGLPDLATAGVMWTVIGNDWSLPAGAVATRVGNGARPGAIVCLHDGRERATRPDITATIAAVAEFLPRLLDQGYTFRTAGEWVR